MAANITVEVIKRDGGDASYTYEQLQEDVAAFITTLSPGTPTKVEIMEGSSGPFAVIQYGADVAGSYSYLDAGNLGMATFVGAAAAGTPGLTAQHSTKIPAIGDKIVGIFGVVTATGVPVAIPSLGPSGQDFDELVVVGPDITQNTAVDLSANTYTVLFVSTP